MADPVSWFLIEPGWKVVDANEEDVGAVDEVVGDTTNDIFNGLAIATGVIKKPRYVEAEQVGVIVEGRVQLNLTRDQIERLSEYEEPPTSAQILPEGAGLVERTEARIEAPIHDRPHEMNVWRRIGFALRRLFR